MDIPAGKSGSPPPVVATGGAVVVVTSGGSVVVSPATGREVVVAGVGFGFWVLRFFFLVATSGTTGRDPWSRPVARSSSRPPVGVSSSPPPPVDQSSSLKIGNSNSHGTRPFYYNHLDDPVDSDQ